MNISILFILFTLSLCEANRLLCEVFNREMKVLEKYCEEYNGKFPVNCSRRANSSENLAVNQVEHIKIGGCNEFIVLDAIERYHQIHSFDISFSRYSSLDWLDSSSFKLERLKKFNASNNKISSISMLFQNAPEIAEIDLSYNRLMAINSSTFGRVDKLVKLHLSHNLIRSIEDDAFAHSTGFEFIDLNDNLLWNIPVFLNNTNLNTIHITRNRITAFNSCLNVKKSIYFSWKYVTSFSRGDKCKDSGIEPIRVIRDNQTEGFLFRNEKYEIHCNAESFKYLNTFVAGRNSYANVTDLIQYFGMSMVKLDLSGNFIEKMGAGTFDGFYDLTILILKDTRLQDFDVNLLKTQYHRLKVLDISDNNLKYMKNISLLHNFRGLQELNLAGNRLENIIELIQHLKSSIERLNLSGNIIGKLNTTTFERLTALKTLNLSKTRLSLPSSNPFGSLKVLRALDISHNYLRNVNFLTFSSTLSKLNKFYASKCEIENPLELISCLGTSVEEVDLSGNFIGMFDIQAFETLINLEFLNLSDTNIFHFNFNTLKRQPLIHSLDISNNKLQEVNFEALHSNVKRLYLEGNDLNRVIHLNRAHFSHLKFLSISQNQLSCDQVKQLMSDWNDLQFIGDPLVQKHGDCGSRTQAVSDFLNDVYDKIRFW